MAVATGTLIAAGLMIGATAYTTAQQNKAAKESRDRFSEQMGAQKEEQNRLQQEYMDKKKQESEKANKALAMDKNKTARDRQRKLAAQAQGRSSTILTDPLSGYSSSTESGKTLLGG
jgi:uncharacterized protein HemX